MHNEFECFASNVIYIEHYRPCAPQPRYAPPIYLMSTPLLIAYPCLSVVAALRFHSTYHIYCFPVTYDRCALSLC